jgi:hypothetical protein
MTADRFTVTAEYDLDWTTCLGGSYYHSLLHRRLLQAGTRLLVVAVFALLPMFFKGVQSQSLRTSSGTNPIKSRLASSGSIRNDVSREVTPFPVRSKQYLLVPP